MARKKGKPPEFSKLLVAWALVFTVLCVGLSYYLAFNDHDACADLTIAVVTLCGGIAVSYEAKSYGEKNSRNKYGIDSDGNRFQDDCLDDEEIRG